MKRQSDEVCVLLDNYLDGALPAEEAAAFVAHLCECAACRDAVDEQQWINGLLRSPAAVELELPLAPPTLPIRKPARRRVLLVAMAAALTCVAAWPLLRGGNELGDGRPSVASLNPHSFALDVAQAEARARAVAKNPSPSSFPPRKGAFVSAGSSIAVAVPCDSPEVTIVQLYPTVTASRRWAREAELRANAIPPNGG